MEKQKKTEHVEKKEKRRRIIHTQKSYLTAGVIMLVAVIAMAGAYQREKKNAENAQNEAVALAENDWVEPETDTSSTGDETQETMAAQTPESQVSDNLNAQTDTTEMTQTDPVQGSTDTTALNSEVQTSEEPVMHFAASDTISWPLEGDVILNYSMDSSVYFATLDQYKYNPALIFGAEEGAQVVSAAKGIVDSITTNDETGTTIRMNLGDQYTLIYGQLENVAVAEGDVVERGQLLGYVAQPTKYYCKEGTNLYFAMEKDGAAEDPFLYLE